MQTEIINKIFEILSSKNPNPRTELSFKNNFTLLVAVALSAQATDVSVNKATAELFISYDDPAKMLLLGEENLKQYIKKVGLYNTKAKNIIALCRILLDKYNGAIPGDFTSLVSLPGVGRKTANVVLNCAFGQHTLAVDTHVYRVARRIGLSNGQTPEQVERDLISSIPAEWLYNAHHYLILHGRYICKARKPDCMVCPIKQYCNYYQNLD